MSDDEKKIEVTAFTFKSKGLLNEIRTDVTVCYGNKMITGDGIWDTGAENTTISQRVINQLHLKPRDKRIMSSTTDFLIARTYLIDLVLPNCILVKDVLAVESNIDKTIGVDVLIGMDVITQGDFCITNVNGNTVFSFQKPSIKTIDFVEELDRIKIRQ